MLLYSINSEISWTHHFRGAQNLKLLWGVILIEICAWRLSFWNPDADRNLPWQHFIATSTDTIVVLMPCHHSCFFNWDGEEKCWKYVVFFQRKLGRWKAFGQRFQADTHCFVAERRSCEVTSSWLGHVHCNIVSNLKFKHHSLRQHITELFSLRFRLEM